MRWTAAIGLGLRATLSRRIAMLSRANAGADNTPLVQRRQLRWLLNRASQTSFGKAHCFGKLAALDDSELSRAYASEIPVQSYDDMKSLLERMRLDAAPDIAWPGVVMDWAQTSGTTSGDKYMPISKEMLKHNAKAAFDVYAHAARFGLSLPKLFAGNMLFLGGSTDLSTSDKGIRTGDLSGVVTRLIRWPISSVVLPGKEIALMDDWPKKIDAMAHRCVNEDVRWISGMPSWSIVLFDRMAEIARDAGREINCLSDLWPNLQVFVHGGVKYGPFERRVRQMWSGDPEGADIPTRIEVYAASEGFIAIQDQPGEPGMRLCADHRIYYEFVPLEEINSDNPQAFACDEVEPGQRYVIVMSTCGGLWRYDIGDVVEFDTIPPAGPPRLRIVGRSRHFMNAFGENIIAEHIENAVAKAAGELRVQVGEFTSAPIYPAQGRPASIELAIEWDATTDQALIERFAQAFDEAIKKQNNDYIAKRSGGVGLATPTVTPLPIGAFHRWMESRGKLGGQHKCPRCANDRGMIDEVLDVSAALAGSSHDG
jgi:GH3 auxin-responsive promoter